MTKRDVNKAVYLCGVNGNYRVIHRIPGHEIICYVPSARIGHAIALKRDGSAAIVRALRALARKRKSKPPLI